MKDKKKRQLELRADEDGLERRYFPVSELRVVRAAEDSDEPTKIVGHSSVFNQWSEDLGGFREKVRPGAFRKAIKRDDVRALWNHNSDFVLGRNKVSETLILREDETGLAIEIVPPDTQFARDFMVSIERGDVSQMSFGFFTVKDNWKYPDDWETNMSAIADRELIEVELFDVSPVTYPAYPQTDVALRALKRHRRDAEEPTQTIEDIINKSNAGETLSDDEKSQVNSAIEALQGIGVPPVPDNATPEGDGDAGQCQDPAALKIAVEIEQEL